MKTINTILYGILVSLMTASCQGMAPVAGYAGPVSQTAPPAPQTWGPTVQNRIGAMNFRNVAPNYIATAAATINNAAMSIRSNPTGAAAALAMCVLTPPAGCVATDNFSAQAVGINLTPLGAALTSLASALQFGSARQEAGMFLTNLVNFLNAFMMRGSDRTIAIASNNIASFAGIPLPFPTLVVQPAGQIPVGTVVQQQGVPVMGTVIQQTGVAVRLQPVTPQPTGVAATQATGMQAAQIIGMAISTLTTANTRMDSSVHTTNADNVIKILQDLTNASKPLGTAVGTSLNIIPTDPNFPQVTTLLSTITSFFKTMNKRTYAGVKTMADRVTRVTDPYLSNTDLATVRQLMINLVMTTVPAVLGLITNPSLSNLAAIPNAGYIAWANNSLDFINAFKTGDAANPIITLATKELDKITSHLSSVSLPGSNITNANDLKTALKKLTDTSVTVLGNAKIALNMPATAVSLKPFFDQLALFQAALTKQTTGVQAAGLAKLTSLGTAYISSADLVIVKGYLTALMNQTIPMFVSMLTPPGPVKMMPQPVPAMYAGPNFDMVTGYAAAMNGFASFINGYLSSGANSSQSGLFTMATKTLTKLTDQLGSRLPGGITNANNLITAFAALNNTATTVIGNPVGPQTMVAAVLPDTAAFVTAVNKFLTTLTANVSATPTSFASSSAYLTASQIQQVAGALTMFGGTVVPMLIGMVTANPRTTPCYMQVKQAINNYLASNPMFGPYANVYSIKN